MALLVRMGQSVSSSDRVGSRFSGTLEAPLLYRGQTVVPMGTPVYGYVASAEKAKRGFGQPKLEVRLTEIMVNGQLRPILTSGVSGAGQSGMGKAARGAAGGAAIGGMVDGGDGAGKGAAIGAAAGMFMKGHDISIPAGGLVEFRLTSPLMLN
jgi:hypothetical protein